MRLAVAAALTGLLSVFLVGCSGNATAPNSPSVDTPAAPTTESQLKTTPIAEAEPVETTAQEPSATTAQYASAVAKERVDFDKQLKTLRDYQNCDWGTPGQVDLPGSIVCMAGVFIAEMEAGTLTSVLEGAQKPGVPAFIGAPPDEIKPLVKDTISAAQNLVKAGKKADPCITKAGAGCEKALFDFSRAMSTMQSQLAGWDPYS